MMSSNSPQKPQFVRAPTLLHSNRMLKLAALLPMLAFGRGSGGVEMKSDLERNKASKLRGVKDHRESVDFDNQESLASGPAGHSAVETVESSGSLEQTVSLLEFQSKKSGKGLSKKELALLKRAIRKQQKKQHKGREKQKGGKTLRVAKKREIEIFPIYPDATNTESLSGTIFDLVWRDIVDLWRDNVEADLWRDIVDLCRFFSTGKAFQNAREEHCTERRLEGLKAKDKDYLKDFFKTLTELQTEMSSAASQESFLRRGPMVPTIPGWALKAAGSMQQRGNQPESESVQELERRLQQTKFRIGTYVEALREPTGMVMAKLNWWLNSGLPNINNIKGLKLTVKEAVFPAFWASLTSSSSDQYEPTLWSRVRSAHSEDWWVRKMGSGNLHSVETLALGLSPAARKVSGLQRSSLGGIKGFLESVTPGHQELLLRYCLQDLSFAPGNVAFAKGEHELVLMTNFERANFYLERLQKVEAASGMRLGMRKKLHDSFSVVMKRSLGLAENLSTWLHQFWLGVDASTEINLLPHRAPGLSKNVHTYLTQALNIKSGSLDSGALVLQLAYVKHTMAGVLQYHPADPHNYDDTEVRGSDFTYWHLDGHSERVQRWALKTTIKGFAKDNGLMAAVLLVLTRVKKPQSEVQGWLGSMQAVIGQKMDLVYTKTAFKQDLQGIASEVPDGHDDGDLRTARQTTQQKIGNCGWFNTRNSVSWALFLQARTLGVPTSKAVQEMKEMRKYFRLDSYAQLVAHFAAFADTVTLDALPRAAMPQGMRDRERAKRALAHLKVAEFLDVVAGETVKAPGRVRVVKIITKYSDPDRVREISKWWATLPQLYDESMVPYKKEFMKDSGHWELFTNMNQHVI